ncbi:MAG: hypothetical protein HY465_02390 [Deltaproteobacteria bacterium]|nr:hypothetical protein [Deltaproteobacteria bacterium]
MFLRIFLFLSLFFYVSPSFAFTTTGFSQPSGVAIDPATRFIYVSNIVGSPTEQDTNAFISRLKADGTIDQMRFIDGVAEGVILNAPKGMAVLKDKLYVADIDVLRVFDVATGKPLPEISFGTMRIQHLYDIEVGLDNALYVTDAPASTVVRIDPANADVKVLFTADELGDVRGLTWDPVRQWWWVAGFTSGKLMAFDGAGIRQSVPTIMIPGVVDLVADDAGNLYASSAPLKSIERVTPTFAVSGFQLGLPIPAGMVVDTITSTLLVVSAENVGSFLINK